MLRRRILPLIALALASPLFAQDNAQQPYVILISLDGFRHDYAKIYDARTLLKLGSDGAVADGLTPAYPSLTAPAHYTLATGMYPDHHGIVDNTFYDPSRGEEFRFTRQSGDGSWYRGEPLWVAAEKAGMRTAVYAWPGNDAVIGGVHATFHRTYADRGTNDEEVNQALDWLRLPDSQRPRLIALYFADVDSVAHRSGAEAPELRPAIQELDRVLGRLWTEARRLPLRINVIVVSDHGMVNRTGTLALRELTDLTQAHPAQGSGAILHLYAPDRTLQDRIFSDLKGKSPEFDVYRRAEIPKRLRYSRDPRIGDLIVVARTPTAIDGRPTVAKDGPPFTSNIGIHGLDPHEWPQMKGIFIASGPNIRAGVRLPAFEAIHVYPLVAKILGLKIPADIDGKSDVARSIYRR